MSLITETGKSYFYQWDTNQVLIVEGEPNCREVHFGYRDGSFARVCQIREEEGRRVVDIPNELLQKDRTFFVYPISDEEDDAPMRSQSFVVLLRPKPDDYVHTEPEMQTYEALEERITALEENGCTGGSAIKTVNGVAPDETGNVEITIPDSGQNVELDTTLTQSGKAADARAVGDVLASKLNAIMVSPDGSKWRITISNEGVMTSEKIIIEIPAAGIALSARALTFDSSVNQTINATLIPADSTDVVFWETSNPDVATVCNGLVTPIGNGSCTITATAGSVSASCEITVAIESGEVVTYSITRNITNATGFDDSTVIGEGSELLECYISNDECTLDGATATVTMGGVDITETAWDNGVVNIAEVTGDVVITLDAVQIQYVVPPIEDFTLDGNLLKAYIGTEEAIELPTANGTTTLQMYGFILSDSVKHVKVPAEMQVWSTAKLNNVDGNKSVLRTVDIYSDVVGFVPKAYTMLEKYRQMKATRTDAAVYDGCTSIRTLAGYEYPDTVTALMDYNKNPAYINMTGLVDGGTIPAHISNMNRAFYGCTNLRRIRVETTAEGADSTSADPYYQTFYGVSKLDIELYLSSGLWSCLRASPNLNWNYKFIDGEPFNRIICFGDSLTGNQSENYPVKLRALVPNNAVVHQCGWGGYTSEQIYQQMITDPYNRYLKDGIIVMYHGTNGYGSDGYDGVTAKMVAALDGNQRYLLIPPTNQGEGDEVYESWKATYGEEHVLSMGDWFANNGYTVSEYQTDGTHFTADGYALVAQAIYEKIQHWL